MEEPRVLSDRYTLVSHLARGGMADVWIAEDQLLGRQVAVKILHGEYALSEAFVERFRREAQAAANLSHANIVAVYDWGQDGETYFMVMELVQGRNLSEVLRTEETLLPRRVAEIGAEVCVALSVAHNQGLVHRDIKPANVLLTPDSAVKVADFGIARAWDDSDQLTKTGAVIGTATYFSPEQAQGHQADARSDIYAVGVVMYELLTGTPPFSGESPVAVAYQHVREVPEPPSSVDPNIPPGLEAIVLKAMAKLPDDRYQSAAEMVEDIDRLLAGQVPLAAPQNEAPTRVITSNAPPPSRQPEAPSGPPPAYEHPVYRDPGGGDRTTMTIGIIAAIALLLLGVILLVRLLGSGEGTAQVVVPDLRGNQAASALDELSALGLQIDQETVTSDEVATGLVIGTEPEAGTEVERGSTVMLLVSGGAATIEVPRVIDLTEEQARAALELLGLEVGEFTFEASPVIEQGIVMNQLPAAGQLVAAGSDVDLVVSAGPNTLTVPDVVGKTESDALFTLSQSGFEADQIRIERQPSAEVLEGFVIETNPEADQLLPVDGFVVVIISEGAVPSVVPSVLDEDPADAQQILEDLGFAVAFDDPVELHWDDPLDGLVVEQDPEAGQTAEFGSTIRLRVGQAATEVPAPNVIDDTPAAARQKIESAGLVFARGPDIELGFGDPADGTVQEQAPPPGTTVAVGSTMTVRVGVAADPVLVPDLIGDLATTCLSQVDAENAITAVGLVPIQGADVILPVADPCDGRVVVQSPDPLTAVALGTDVTYQIGVADVLLGVGTIIGSDVATVQATYPTLVWTQNTPTGTCVPAGAVDPTRIGWIDPAEGITVPGGSTVIYWLEGAGPPNCSDPPVTGA